MPTVEYVYLIDIVINICIYVFADLCRTGRLCLPCTGFSDSSLARVF